MAVYKDEQGRMKGKCDYCKKVYTISRKSKWKDRYICPLCENEARKAVRNGEKRTRT